MPVSSRCPKRSWRHIARIVTASELGRILATAKRLGGAGGSRGGAGHRRFLHGRSSLDGRLLPTLFQRTGPWPAGRPPADVLRGKQRRQRCDARAAQPARAAAKSPHSLDDRWGIVVISKSGGTLETAVAFRQFLAALRQVVRRRRQQLSRQLVVPVTGQSGKLFDLAQAIGCPEIFHVPDGVGGRFSVLSPVGLLPAAILGLDVVRLLEGAAGDERAFSHAHRRQQRGAAVCRRLPPDGKKRKATIRVLSVWSKALEAVGLWYDQLLAESLGKQEQGATPITAVNTRDLHSRAQQHQEGRRDKLHTNLIVDHWRTDPLPVGASDLNQDELNKHADKTLPEIMAAAIAGTNRGLPGRWTPDGRYSSATSRRVLLWASSSR